MKNLQINLHPLSVLLLIAAVAYGFSIPSSSNGTIAEAINNHAAAIERLDVYLHGEAKLTHEVKLDGDLDLSVGNMLRPREILPSPFKIDSR